MFIHEDLLKEDYLKWDKIHFGLTAWDKLFVTITGFLVNAMYAESEATNNILEPKGNSGTAVYSSDSARRE